MSVVANITQHTQEIVSAAGGKVEAMPINHLEQIATRLRICAMAHGMALAERCGDTETSSREIVRAIKLSSSVFKRRLEAARQAIARNEVPNIREHAAYIAGLIATVRSLDADIARRKTVN